MQSIVFNNKNISPSKIVCVGRNYLDHIKELNNAIPEEPVLFIKPNSAISRVLAIDSARTLHYETELCLLIESQKIVGIGLGLDLTDRNLQSKLKQKGLPWEKAKSFDGAAVFSAFTPLENTNDLADLSFTLTINGSIKQHGVYEHMLHKPESLVQYIQTYFSLNDHDIVMTGTPEGVGEVKPNDIFELSLAFKEKIVLTTQYVVGNR